MQLAAGVRAAKLFIREWQPDVVIGFGGYPAFPAMRAAQSLNIPTIIHEQNAVLGRVNRVFAAKALHVACGFADLAKCPKGANITTIGNPLRQQIIDAIPTTYQAPTDRINLLIVGGALGRKLFPKLCLRRLHCYRPKCERSCTLFNRPAQNTKTRQK
ncbi:glycosyltransferase [Litorimonas sp. RW-G-Af-16]|uniref:UDP-N-acetylglucosamine--N-acetylmuramyl- (pentapeptide) pyrophosphoryl-undecaprenol N-acetylglucosamine transferase n=1 Tax=Litorimonas sp. RW-G-Af-16 TaxID=3241168 RepID=UPI003AAD890F